MEDSGNTFKNLAGKCILKRKILSRWQFSNFFVLVCYHLVYQVKCVIYIRTFSSSFTIFLFFFPPVWYMRARWKVFGLAYNRHNTQDKRLLGRDLDRSWCHRYTSVKLSWSHPMDPWTEWQHTHMLPPMSWVSHQSQARQAIFNGIFTEGFTLTE